jgi:nitrate/TMAO reductase-like tetraheme cytochrome c subunit
MNQTIRYTLALGVALVLAAGTLVWQVRAADDHEIIENVMKTFHKAPKGTDPTCKKASDGKASPDELKQLVAAYEKLAATKPPKGDEASWKDKTSKLLMAARALQKGDADGVAKYKQAVNCKACHDVHKPE